MNKLVGTILFVFAAATLHATDLIWEGTPQHHMRSDGTIETWRDLRIALAPPSVQLSSRGEYVPLVRYRSLASHVSA